MDHTGMELPTLGLGACDFNHYTPTLCIPLCVLVYYVCMCVYMLGCVHVRIICVCVYVTLCVHVLVCAYACVFCVCVASGVCGCRPRVVCCVLHSTHINFVE